MIAPFPLRKFHYDTDIAVRVGDFLCVVRRRTGVVCSVYHVVHAKREDDATTEHGTGFEYHYWLHCERWRENLPADARTLTLYWHPRKGKKRARN